MMPTAVKMEVSPETIIRAVKGMKKPARQAFMEDLIAATSPEYLQSIRDARRDFKIGKVRSHTTCLASEVPAGLYPASHQRP